MAYHYRQSGPEYELKETLGKGSFGVVQRCVETRTGREYAAKIIDTRRMSRRDLERMEREAEICRMLKHENIVQLHDSFHMRGQYIMIFDLITGGELFEDIVAREFYNEASAADCIRFVLNAIAYCHDLRVMHRDLKPENILLATKAKGAPVKITDFGLALKVPDNTPRCYGLAGTYVYMAPEVIADGPYNLSADIWSCGVILYLLLCGYPPFWDTDDEMLKRKVVHGRHSFPLREWNMVSQEAKDLINQMLDKNPARRITANQALSHSWLRPSVKIEKTAHLREAVIHLKQFNARRKMKGAVLTAMVALRQFRNKSSNADKHKSQTNVNSQENQGNHTEAKPNHVSIHQEIDHNVRTGGNTVPVSADVKVIHIDERQVTAKNDRVGSTISVDDKIHNDRPSPVFHPDLSTLEHSSLRAEGDWFFDEALSQYHPRDRESMVPTYIRVRSVVNQVVPVATYRRPSVRVPLKSILVNRRRSVSFRKQPSYY